MIGFGVTDEPCSEKNTACCLTPGMRMSLLVVGDESFLGAYVPVNSQPFRLCMKGYYIPPCVGGMEHGMLEGMRQRCHDLMFGMFLSDGMFLLMGGRVRFVVPRMGC